NDDEDLEPGPLPPPTFPARWLGRVTLFSGLADHTLPLHCFRCNQRGRRRTAALRQMRKWYGMLQLSAAGKRFGPKLLFEDVNWLITPNERTGLVGGNGTGKSTLLKILAGIESLDYGTRTHTKGMTLGYLPQDGLALSGRSVFEECLSVFDEIRALEREYEQLTHTMSEADPKSSEYHAAADRYSEIADLLHAHDIYTLDAQVGAVLAGLGFSKEDWQ